MTHPGINMKVAALERAIALQNVLGCVLTQRYGTGRAFLAVADAKEDYLIASFGCGIGVI